MALPPRVSVCTFLSTPSARRATSVWMVFMSELQNFYPRPPRGGRQSPCGRACNPRDFYPRPPRGGRQPPARVVPRRGQFLSTPSARRATTLPPLPCAWLANFYPRPPRGGRRRCSKAPTSSRTISIHALREEGDAAGLPGKARPPYFYPRPPRGGRQGRAKRVFQGRNISIHALREEGDLHRSGRGRGQRPISIHALREEGDAGV